MPYWLITTGPEGQPGINGGLLPRQCPGASTVNTVTVDSVDDSLKAIERKGGKINSPEDGRCPESAGSRTAWTRRETRSGCFSRTKRRSSRFGAVGAACAARELEKLLERPAAKPRPYGTDRLDQPRDPIQIHVAARDDRDDARPRRQLDLPGDQRPGRRGSRSLDVELGPRHQQAHPLADLLLGHGHDLVDGLARDLERQRADERRRHAVGERRGPRHGDRLSGRERRRETRARRRARRRRRAPGAAAASPPRRRRRAARRRRPARRRPRPPGSPRRSRGPPCRRRRARRGRRRDGRTSGRARPGPRAACRRASAGRGAARSRRRSRAPRRSWSAARRSA